MTSLAGADAPTTTTAPAPIPGVSGREWSWNRPPTTWGVADGGVMWTCPGSSDFWRKTEGVPPAHDGCSLLTLVDGDFEFELLVRGAFSGTYDQVGLMVVSSEVSWLKAGVEVDGEPWLSAVHTREESDWSRERWQSTEARLRAIRHDGTIEVFVAEGEGWRVFRTLFLPGPVGVGPYSCSPKGEGFEASASNLRIN
jgi:uncharacterized protein